MKPQRGLSVTLSTVMMGSAILISTLAVVMVANQMIEYQAQDVEFGESKSALLLFATAAEDVSLKPQSASHAIVHTRAGGFHFKKNVGQIQAKVINGTTETIILTKNVNQLRYQAGHVVNAYGLGYLRGNGSLIVKGFSDPIGHVYTNQTDAAWVILDYARIRVVRHGSFYLYNQTGQQEKVNLIEVTFVNLLLGEFGGTGTVRVRAENLNVTTTAQRFKGNTVTVQVSYQGNTSSYVVAGAADDVATVVNLVQAYVRFTTS